MPSAVSILVRLRTVVEGGVIDAQLALRRLKEDGEASGKALDSMRGSLVSLAPAAIPVAASLAQFAPVAGHIGAAAVAVGAFGAAIAPQFAAMSDTAAAAKDYTAAVKSGGEASKQAVAAGIAYREQLAALPPAAQRGAMALGHLQDAYKGWSDSLAGDTLPVAIHGFAVLEAVFPRLTPMVKGASVQLDRLTTALAGGMQSPGLDKLNAKFTAFAVGSLKSAVDGVIHFSRVLSEGGGPSGGGVAKFMDYARANGPAVRETLTHLGEALLHLGQAASNAGPGMLSVVNVLATVVSAVPPEVLTRLLQMYTAFKLIRTAGLGLAAVSSSVGVLTRSLAAMATASTAAGGGLVGLRAAFMSLSTATRATIVIAGIAAVALALKNLTETSHAAPPDIDRMTTSIGNLGRTGKMTGEALQFFGEDMAKLNNAVASLSGKSADFDKAMSKLSGPAKKMAQEASTKELGAQLDVLDKSLANLVQGGKADTAAAALEVLTASYAKGGEPVTDLTGKLDDYNAALNDAAFEQRLAAESQGMFGQQAQEVQKSLDAQKQSADGLRQSIQALNDVNRAGLDGMVAFEQAIDDAAAAAKDSGAALKGPGNALNLNSQKARDAAKALSNLAAQTDAATGAARDSGKSWEEVSGIYDRGRDALIRTAMQMGRTRSQAKALADQILKTPDKTAFLKGDISDLSKKLTDAKARLAAAPKSKQVAIRAEIADLQKKLAAAQRSVDRLHGKTITVQTNIVETHTTRGSVFHEGGGYGHGGVVGAASGGPRSGRTLVGEWGPELVDLAAGSTVHSANATRQMVAAGGGGGPRPIVQVNLVLNGNVLAQQLVDPFRDVVRDLGGDVQNALGRRN